MDPAEVFPLRSFSKEKEEEKKKQASFKVALSDAVSPGAKMRILTSSIHQRHGGQVDHVGGAEGESLL